MKVESLKLKIESYFNCSSLLRREAGREGKKGGRGFTLAEVLIALTIIGVISAVTMPVLMQNTQKHEYVTALKKAYSVLSQASNIITAEEGSPKSSDSSSKDGWAYSQENIYKMYKKYLYNAKECGTGSGCFEQLKGKSLANGKLIWNNYEGAGFRKLILSDGMQIVFNDGNYPLCNHGQFGSSNMCTAIFVDVNGVKKPNIWGRDIFFFALKADGLHPGGCDNEVQSDCINADGSKGSGTGCACKVLREGAMNY